ncbi:MAG: tetratricopeptide repeat protein [Bacteroidia bacterium]|nr:tetratricopeptide repeat protein [Bacteroidia bacterium]
MNSYQKYILLLTLVFACITLVRGQSEKIYQLRTSQEDISSAELNPTIAENFIKTSGSLTYEHPDSALLLANKAILIAQGLRRPELEADAFRRLGLVLFAQDELSSSIHYLHRAEELYEETNAPNTLRRIYNNLGVVCEYMGDKQQALSYYFKSLEQAEIEENIQKQISAISNLGDLSTRSQQFESGKEFLQKGLKLAQEENDEVLTARLNMQLGMLYLHKEEFQNAEASLTKALSFYTQNKEGENLSHLAHTNNGLGILAEKQSRFSEAKDYYEKSLVLYQEAESSEEVVVYINLGSLAQREKSYKKALNYYQTALDHPSVEDNIVNLKNVYWNLSLVYGQLNNITKAYEYQNAYAVLSDSIHEAEIRETASRAELLYTQARGERKEEASKLELEKQKTLSNYYLLAGSIAGLLALIFFLYMRNYRQRKEALKKELVLKEESNKLMLVEMLRDHEVETLNAMLDGQENERKRIARDLHDSLGGTLAAVQMTLASLERKLPEIPEKAKKTYDKAEYLLDQAYQQMRGISHNLADLSLKDGGLSPALAQLKDTLSENTNLNIRMDYTSLGGRRLDSNVEQHSYRITQELFQNIIKHAEASLIEYELNYSPIKLHISIKDDGKGFEYEPGSKVSGIGLNNILTRVRQLDGEMEIQSKPGEGTLIEVDIPLVLS